MTETALFRLSQARLNDSMEWTPTQAFIDQGVTHFLDQGVTHFLEESAKFSTFASVVAGGGASRLTRTGILALGANATGRGAMILQGLAEAGSLGAELAEKIRKAVEATPIEIEGHAPIHITVSLGVAELRALPRVEEGGEPVSEGSLKDTMDRANQALYVAKNSGRNRVVVSEE